MRSLYQEIKDKWPVVSLDKPIRDKLLNLSSNILYHPKLKDLQKNFLSSIGSFNEYPNYEPLRDKIAKMHNLGRDCIGFSAGSDLIIATLVQMVSSFNISHVFIQDPSYYNFINYLQRHHVSFQKITLQDIFKSETLKLLAKKEPTFIFLTSPCPHTGEIIDHAELKKWLDDVFLFGHFVILDQTYTGFGCPSYINLLNENSQLLIFQSFSKNYGAAGLRLAFFAGSPYVVCRLRSLGVEDAMSRLAIEYALFALEQNHEFEKIRNEIITWREMAYHQLLGNFKDFYFFRSFANFVSFDTHSIEKATKVIRNCLTQKRIYLKQQPVPSRLRITVADPETFNKVYLSIAEVVNE